MMKISLLTILLITGVFAQELEVEGSLKVIGEIDAQGNAITVSLQNIWDKKS